MAKNNGKVVSIKAAKRGRPPVYTGALETAIVKVIARNGLMRGQRILATEGVQRRPGVKREPLKISLPTLGKLAERHGIELKPGRPLKIAA